MTNRTDRETAFSGIKKVVGNRGWITDPNDMKPFVTEWLKILSGSCEMVVLPGSSSEVAQVVRICNSAGIPITPQGGNTGMVGGAVP